MFQVDHFYTTSDAERDNAVANFGYTSEGDACFVFASQIAGTTPLHRLFNAQTGDHFYTTSDAERDNAVANFGYTSEGDACFVFASQIAGTTPLHRLFNAQIGDHFYTTSDAERDNAVANFGYTSEGDACFVFASQAPGTVPLHRVLLETTTRIINLSGLSLDDHNRQFLVTQGIAGYTLVAGKQCLFRIFVDQSKLALVDSMVFSAASPILAQPVAAFFRKDALITESAAPNGPSVGVIIRGFAFPKAGMYSVTLAARMANGSVLQKLVASNLSFLPTADLRVVEVHQIHDGVFNSTTLWALEVERAMLRFGAMLPVRDGVQGSLNGNRQNGLRYAIGKDADGWKASYYDDVYGQTLAYDAILGGDQVDVTIEFRPGFYPDDYDPPGDPSPGGNSGRPPAPYANLRRASCVSGIWQGISMTPAAFGQEIGHNFGLEPPNSPHSPDPADPGHSKDAVIVDPYAFDFVHNWAFKTPIGDTMNNSGGGAFMGGDQEAYNTFDWEFLRNQFVQQLNSTGTEVNPAFAPGLWMERGPLLHLAGVSADGGLWHTIRFPAEPWQQFGDLRATAQLPAKASGASCASSSNTLHLCAVTVDGRLFHTIRGGDRSWQQFDDVSGQAGNRGAIAQVGCAFPAADLHVAAVAADGRLWHTVRDAIKGTWQQFGDVSGQAGNRGQFVDVDCAGLNGELHLCATTKDGRLWHTIRHADGSWEQFGDVSGQAGNVGIIAQVTCAFVAGELHVVAVAANGRLWHTIRHADGSWQQFGDVAGVAGNRGSFTDAAAGETGGELHLSATTADHHLWHTIRHADGTWQQFGDVEGAAGWHAGFTAVTVDGLYTWHRFYDGSSWGGPGDQNEVSSFSPP